MNHAALSLIRHYVKAHQPLILKLFSGRTLFALTASLDLLSLGYVVDLLVSFGISPKDIERTPLSQL